VVTTVFQPGPRKNLLAHPGAGAGSYAIKKPPASQRVIPVKLKPSLGLDLKKVEGCSLRAAGTERGQEETLTISLLTTPCGFDKGSAKLAGYDVVKQPGMVRRNIGATFQEVSLDRSLTGRSASRYSRAAHQLPR